MLKQLIAKLRSNRGEIKTAEGTKESGAKESGQSGEKLEGLIEDINFDDVDENLREAVKAKVAAKIKNYDSGYRAKSEDLSTQRKELESRSDSLKELEKLRDEIQGNPEFEKVINKTITDFRAGKVSTEKQFDKKLSKIENLIDKAETAEERERLQLMKEIIHEETKGNSSSEEFKTLKEEIAQLKAASSVGLSSAVNIKMAELESKFGEAATKYKDQIKTLLTRHSIYLDTPEKVFYQVVPVDEAEKALSEYISNKTKLDNKKKEEGIFPRGESTPKKFDMPRDKTGKVNWKEYADKASAEGRFT